MKEVAFISILSGGDSTLMMSGSEEQLHTFLTYLIDINTNVKLSLSYSRESTHFLDLTAFKDNHGNLHPSMFRRREHRTTCPELPSQMAERRWTSWPVQGAWDMQV